MFVWFFSLHCDFSEHVQKLENDVETRQKWTKETAKLSV